MKTGGFFVHVHDREQGTEKGEVAMSAFRLLLLIICGLTRSIFERILAAIDAIWDLVGPLTSRMVIFGSVPSNPALRHYAA